MEFFRCIWLYLAFTICGAVGFYLYTQKNEINHYKLLSGLALICVPLHMFEERIFPGGFHYIVSITTGGGQTQTNVMLMNVAALIILTALFIQKGAKPWFSGIMAFLGIMECVSHMAAAVSSYSVFCDVGLRIPYSPGYFVCLFLFLPLSLLQFRALIKARDFKWRNLKWMLLWLVVICVFTLALPNRLLHGFGDAFPDCGFYEQFLN